MDIRSIAVVQLDGPSELVSSAPAVAALRHRFPKAQIHLVTSKKLLEIADLIPETSSVMESGKENIKVDLRVSLGFTGESLIAASRIECAESIGPRIDSAGGILLDDGWTRYHESVVSPCALNPFHRAEVLTSVAGCQWIDPDFYLRASADEVLSVSAKYFSSAPHLKVAVAPGALENDESEELIHLLRDGGFSVRFYFLGTLKDRPSITSLMRHLGPAAEACSNLAGEISARESALLSMACDVMIAPPGTDALFSSGFGTFTICAMPRTLNTYLDIPYGQGHICVQSEDGAPRGRAVAEILAHAITANNGNPPSLGEWQAFFDERIDEHIGHVRIFHSARAVTNYGSGRTKSEMQLFPLIYSGASHTDAELLFSRIQWESVLNECESSGRDLGLLQDAEVAPLKEAARPLQHLAELSMHGQRCSVRVASLIRDGRAEQANAEANKLQEIDELIRSLAGTAPALAPMARYFFLNQSQIFDLDPLDVAEKMRLCYVLMQHQAMLLIDLIARSTESEATIPENEGIVQEAIDGQS